MILHIPSDLAVEIRRRVGEAHQTPDDVVRAGVLLVEPRQDRERYTPKRLTAEEWITQLRLVVATLPGSGRFVDDSREAIYEGCGE
jgi:hypothetical protein